ncbi:MAG: bile acid:sodium symporter [Planctomycetaceae bacterium]|nr:bile acid:sodium symporter [Planctomycetaceae bacterium]
MTAALRRHWFLVGLVTLLPLAVVLGTSNPSDLLVRSTHALPTSWCTAAILFLMSVTLDTGRLVDSLRRPLPVVTAISVNQIVLPLACLPLLPLQKSADLRVGLLIAASVPCTMAAASVWTRRAGGNDAVSLLVTLITNGLCFLFTPFWLAVGQRWFGTVSAEGSLEPGDMVVRLVTAALIPAAAGQLLRRHRGVAARVDVNKKVCSNTAQTIILTLVFVSAFKGGLRFQNDGMIEGLRHTEFAVVWFSCLAIHVLAMVVAWTTGGVFQLGEADRRACVIAGSQKTLPIGILVSQSTGLPFSLVPMLMFHTSQLFIDTWVADRLQRRNGLSDSSLTTQGKSDPASAVSDQR